MATVDIDNAGVAPRGDYADILRQIITDGGCPFCMDNFRHYHPKPILAENSHWVVTENNWPYPGTLHHLLFVPKEHVEYIESLDNPQQTSFFDLYREISLALGLVGATLLWRSGNTSVTGATVVHLHAHLVVGRERLESSVPIQGLVGFKDP